MHALNMSTSGVLQLPCPTPLRDTHSGRWPSDHLHGRVWLALHRRMVGVVFCAVILCEREREERKTYRHGDIHIHCSKKVIRKFDKTCSNSASVLYESLCPAPAIFYSREQLHRCHALGTTKGSYDISATCYLEYCPPMKFKQSSAEGTSVERLLESSFSSNLAICPSKN